MDWNDSDRARGDRLEQALAARLYGGDSDEPLFARLDRDQLAETAHSVRQMVRGRCHRGTGSLTDWYPRSLAGWDLDELLRRYCASAACEAWRELTTGGVSLEESLYRFFCQENIGDPQAREEEFLSCVVRALAVTPDAQFVWPFELRAGPGGCFAVSRAHVLHAALDGRYVSGPITPLLVALLGGMSSADAATRFKVAISEAEAVRASLRSLRLLP